MFSDLNLRDSLLYYYHSSHKRHIIKYWKKKIIFFLNMPFKISLIAQFSIIHAFVVIAICLPETFIYHCRSRIFYKTLPNAAGTGLYKWLGTRCYFSCASFFFVYRSIVPNQRLPVIIDRCISPSHGRSRYRSDTLVFLSKFYGKKDLSHPPTNRSIIYGRDYFTLILYIIIAYILISIVMCGSVI